ncbi:Endosulfine-domain-containing protein [Trametes gibbosa]|nr:Endosulfine-domain-containing protein [Trametes gibbosa]
MLPAKRNKVDLSKLTEEEQKLFRLYGKLPTHKNVLTKMQKERKFFDSGDYALSKAGKAPQNAVGTAIPSPENIPHATSPPVHQALSVSPTNSTMAPIPSKESPLAETKPVEDDELASAAADADAEEGSEEA